MTRVSFARAILNKVAGVANISGRDNRTPFVGNTQFPTEGSKSFSQKIDRESKAKAEKGPAPLMGELDKTRMTTLGQVATKMPSPIGSLPKIGGAMPDSSYQDDPLVQYLEKEAEEIKNNLKDMDLGQKEEEMQAKDSDFVDTPAAKKRKEEDALLKSLFKHYPGEQAKVTG